MDNDIIAGNELDNSALSRIINEGIKVNITKNFNNKIWRFKFLSDRKKSGFSFLDISLQKKKINFGEDIDEIKDEENSDEIESFLGTMKNEQDNDNNNFDEDEEEEKSKLLIK